MAHTRALVLVAVAVALLAGCHALSSDAAMESRRALIADSRYSCSFVCDEDGSGLGTKGAQQTFTTAPSQEFNCWGTFK